MKGSLLWKLMYVFCALAGMLAGYGVFTLSGSDEIKPNTNTKDNTLVRDAEDSVFFDGINEVEIMPTVPVMPTVTVAPVIPVEPTMPVVPTKTPDVELPELQEGQGATATPEPVVSVLPEVTEVPGELPSMASQWMEDMPEIIPTPLPVIPPVAEVITYPAEIFGQVPVINRSDTYVSYFEFAYDLINMLEPEVERRGLNMNSLLAKFVLKALFCGVDIAKLDINAPIPRRLAALCLWLAAQMLGENGCDTSAKSAQKYVTDISGCSSAEKKAVAYLYEQGILKGYQVAGQQFYPEAGLTTESGSTWLSRVKQCWK